MKTVHVLISGQVQGVFYRLYMQKKALSLNLSGWVKNRDDGRVEAVFQGNEKTVRKMLDWLWQGSPGSKVKGVKQLNDKPIKDFEGFEIRY